MEIVEMNLEFIVCEEDEVQTVSDSSITSAPTSASFSTGLDALVVSQIEENEEPIQSPSSLPKGKYQRPDVTLFDRLEIARRYLEPDRSWGEVTKMAKEYALSRVTIYAIILRVILFFQPGVPGPRAGQSTVIKEVVQSLTAEEAKRLRGRLILTGVFPGGGTMRSLEDMLDEVPGVDGSATTIWRIVDQKGAEASAILQSIDFAGVSLSVILVAIDETYFDGRPIFMVVEPISLAICGFYVPADGNRGSLTWGPFLLVLQEDQHLNFEGAMGDGATAYPGTIESILERDDRFQEDIFHIERDLSALRRKLENKAYRAFEKEEEAQKKWHKDPTAENKTAWEQAKSASQELAQNYAALVEYSSWVSDAFEIVDLRSGEIRDRAIDEWLLDAAIEAMLAVKDADVIKMGRRLRKHKPQLLTYLNGLDAALPPLRESLHRHLDDPDLEKAVLRSVARHWRLQHEVHSNQRRNFRPSLKRTEQDMRLWIEGDPFLEEWAQQLQTVLDAVQRTSSAAENINSILKPLLTRKKHFANAETTHNFIALFVLWHNLRVFKEGKRKGKSPFDILGIDLGERDWRTLLGYLPL